MAFDVDGVLTDGSLIYGADGEQVKVFNSLDGHGIKMLQQAGIHTAIISGRGCAALELRAANLGIKHLFQNVHDKPAALAQLLTTLNLNAEQAGYMGDDIVDIAILRRCGFSATPHDGHPFVREHVDFITQRGGGRGAVRETCDFILAAQGKLETMHQACLE